jgi:hypothetical protein
MLAHGFTIPQMVELVPAGLASASAERIVAGDGWTSPACASQWLAGGAGEASMALILKPPPAFM